MLIVTDSKEESDPEEDKTQKFQPFGDSIFPKKITYRQQRVWVLAGSDIDMVHSEAFGPAIHRLIVSEDIAFERDSEYYKRVLKNWEVRRIPQEPYWRMTVTDDAVIYEPLNETYKPKGFSILKDKKDLERGIKAFEEIWDIAEPYNPFLSDLTDKIEQSKEGHTHLIHHLSENPEGLFAMNPNDFEHFIAELLRRDKFEVALTPQSRDGGKDILSWQFHGTRRRLNLVECKRYAKNHKVGVAAVRGFVGVIEGERASSGMIVTTSDFSKPAKLFQIENSLEDRVILINFGELAKWIRRISERMKYEELGVNWG